MCSKTKPWAPARRKTGQPVSYRVRVSLQSLSHLSDRPPWTTTIGHANAPAPVVLALDTSVPLRHLHSVATFPGVAPYPSYHPPPPLNFFYRIAQLLYGFALLRVSPYLWFRTGFYPVFLFRSDGSGFYLSLDLGTGRQYGTPSKTELWELHVNAEYLSSFFTTLQAQGFSRSLPMDLRTDKGVAVGFATGSIIHKLYDRTDLPSSVAILRDLMYVLKFYQSMCDSGMAGVLLDAVLGRSPHSQRRSISRSLDLLGVVRGFEQTRWSDLLSKSTQCRLRSITSRAGVGKLPTYTVETLTTYSVPVVVEVSWSR